MVSRSIGRSRTRRSVPPSLDPAGLLRRRLRTRATVRRATIAVAVVAVVLLAATTVADRPARPDVAMATATIATRDVPTGATIGPGDVERRAVPRDFVPPGTAVDPVGRVAASPILDGEIVRAARLTDGGPLGLGPDEVAVAVPIDGASLPLDPGDVVELIAIRADPISFDAAAVALGRARVVAVDDSASITIAVPAAVAADILVARATGSIEVALTPFGS